MLFKQVVLDSLHGGPSVESRRMWRLQVNTLVQLPTARQLEDVMGQLGMHQTVQSIIQTLIACLTTCDCVRVQWSHAQRLSNVLQIIRPFVHGFSSQPGLKPG